MRTMQVYCLKLVLTCNLNTKRPVSLPQTQSAKQGDLGTSVS